MIGLVIATHGTLAEGLFDAARSIVGPQARVQTLGLARDTTPEDLQALLRQAITAVAVDGDGALIMTDLLGGTPTNASLSLYAAGECEILAGVNLPMLLKFFNSRTTLTLTPLARLLRDYGRQGVTLLSDLLDAPPPA